MVARWRPLFLAILACFLSISARGADESVYGALRAARPGVAGVAVKDLLLERDVFRIRFDAGTFSYLPALESRTVGAVFVGRGSYELAPATEVEARHLAFRTGEKGLTTLTDTFASMVLLFSDATADELRAAGKPKTAAGVNFSDPYEKFLRREKHDFKTNFHLRLLEDLLNREDSARGVFLAFVDGKKYPYALLAVDPHGIERLGLGDLLAGEKSALYVAGEPRRGFWYLSASRGEKPNASATPGGALAATHYEVETEITDDNRIRATTVLHFTCSSGKTRVVRLNLEPKLRLQKAEYARLDEGKPAWVAASVVQEPEDEDADAAVILPAPVDKGEKALLRLSYGGKDIVLDRGEESFAVGSRTSWYPNLGVFHRRATFDLTFRVPKAHQVISVGKLVEERVEGNRRLFRWRAEEPLLVAGFNYGTFQRLVEDDRESNMHLELYTNRGEEGRSIGTGEMADTTLADATNAARVFTTYYGPLRENRVLMTQQAQWNFGQSWPGLIFLPYMAFLDGGIRRNLGLSRARDFVEEVGAHEFAHQWWGQLVGWESYHDQWLSEGFAEFSAALFLQHSAGMRKYIDFWEKARKRIVEKPTRSEVHNDEAGPIFLGGRLATLKGPDAYQAMIYEKGAFILHMLRMMMWDSSSGDADLRFMETMKDYAATFAGRNASTDDFQKVIERHQTAMMDLARDGKMDWFFTQWVRGMEIPRYRSKLELRDEAHGRYRISGTVSQEGVSSDFRTLLPIYVEFSGGKIRRVGMIPLTGSASAPVDVVLSLPEKPSRVAINYLRDVLARD